MSFKNFSENSQEILPAEECGYNSVPKIWITPDLDVKYFVPINVFLRELMRIIPSLWIRLQLPYKNGETDKI